MPITYTQTGSVHKFYIPEPVPEMVVLPMFEGSIGAGSIPPQVKRLKCLSMVTELVEGAIPNSVTHLFLRDLNEKMVIPSSVKHLFVINFRKDMIQFVPSTVTHLYVHSWDIMHAPTDYVHYVFNTRSVSKTDFSQDGLYEVGQEYSEHFFTDPTTIVKRTPRAISSTLEETLRANCIIVGETYIELTIEDDHGDLVLPDGFNHKLRPGDVPLSTKRIRFNDEYNQKLEPGVINETVEQLVLGKGFKQPLQPGAIPVTTDLYIYTRNQEFVPTDQSFFLYENICAGPICPSETVCSMWDFNHSCSKNRPEMEPEQGSRLLVGKQLWVSGLFTPKAKVIDTTVKTKIDTAVEAKIDTTVEAKIDTPVETKIDAPTETLVETTTDIASPSIRDLELKIDNIGNDMLAFSKTMLETVKLLGARISVLEERT